MSRAVSEKINPNRVVREPFGLKGESSLTRITQSPPSASPGQTLYINIPKLADNDLIYPGSVYLVFNLNVTGHANNTLVDNVGRNLVSRLKVKFAGETLEYIQGYDLLKTYQDLYLSKEDRDNRLKQGISSLNMRKLRTNAGDKVTSDAGEVALAAIYNTKYCIPLDHPILSDHGVFYPRALAHSCSFELTLAPISNIVSYTDTTKSPSYSITNLELEYLCLTSEYLAEEAAASYKVAKGFFYENFILADTFTISKPNDGFISQHINIPRRSMTGILCLFTENQTAGTRDSERFVNPDINSVHIDIEGKPNRLFSGYGTFRLLGEYQAPVRIIELN